VFLQEDVINIELIKFIKLGQQLKHDYIT